jgi:cysteine desulfurase
VDAAGRLDLAQFEKSLRSDTAIATLLWANNETGVLFPIEEIAAIARAKKTVLHIDAVQAFGKIPLSLEGMGIHFMSFSGHKIQAPKGVGALYASRRIRFTPLLRGSQEDSRRGGTQNVASIVAFGAAAELAASHIGESATLAALRDRLESSLLAAIPGSTVNGAGAPRLPNTTNISFEGIQSDNALLMLDERGICCSAGSACTTGSVHASHVLKAMGLPEDRARASLRFSLGRQTTESEIARAIETIPAVILKLRSLTASPTPVLTS